MASSLSVPNHSQHEHDLPWPLLQLSCHHQPTTRCRAQRLEARQPPALRGPGRAPLVLLLMAAVVFAAGAVVWVTDTTLKGASGVVSKVGAVELKVDRYQGDMPRPGPYLVVPPDRELTLSQRMVVQSSSTMPPVPRLSGCHALQRQARVQ